MTTTPDLTIFGKRLGDCLNIHHMDTAELAERTAIEEQRLDALLRNADDLRCYELDSIADAFRIEPSLLVSNAELPYDTYRVACGHYDITTIHKYSIRRLRVFSQRLLLGASQSSYKQRKGDTGGSLGASCDVDNDSESFVVFTADNYKKIMSTLSACQLLQELWEKELWGGEKYPSHEFSHFTDLPCSYSPEECGTNAANHFRAMFGLRPNESVTHIRQYARKMGVHVFRQKIHTVIDASQEDLPFHGVCLAGTIGNNKNVRIIIFDSSLPYFEEQFCVAHELGHAILDDASTWDNRLTLRSCGVKKQEKNDRSERMANAFALELLFPCDFFVSLNNFRKVISDIVGINKSSEQVFCHPEKIASQLLRDKDIGRLTAQHEELREQLQKVARQEPASEALHDYDLHYSPALRNMFRCLQQGRYTARDIDRLKDLINSGLSHHFVEVCKRAYGNDSGKKEDIISRCAEVFTVSTLRIEEAFEMYEFLPAKQA